MRSKLSARRPSTRTPKPSRTLLLGQLIDRAVAAERKLLDVERQLRTIKRSYRSATAAVKSAKDDLALARRRESDLESEASKRSSFDSVSELRKYLAATVAGHGFQVAFENDHLDKFADATLTVERDGVRTILRIS